MYEVSYEYQKGIFNTRDMDWRNVSGWISSSVVMNGRPSHEDAKDYIKRTQPVGGAFSQYKSIRILDIRKLGY